MREVGRLINERYFALAQQAAAIAGLPAEFVYSQWVHETGNFTSDLCTQYNNLGGLTQAEPNDLPQPDGNCYYMQFNSPEAYADYFGRYLRLYREDGIYEAATIPEYAAALYRGGYFGDTVENYAAGMLAAHKEAFG